MLDKIFSWSKKKNEEEAEPEMRFGRYSDNNKSMAKVERWNDAESLFKEKKHFESIAAFFEYLRDDEIENVYHSQEKTGGVFEFYQGSKIIRGKYSETLFEAEAVLAQMPMPSVPVMRRLLEMNFNLYYTRYALDGEKLTMMFDSDIATAN